MAGLKHAAPLQGPEVGLALNARELDALVAELGSDESPDWSDVSPNGAITWTMHDRDGRPAWIVGVGAEVGIATTPEYLVHEAVHVWQGYREYIGESKPSDEFEAYSIQGIFSTLLLEFSRSRSGRKRIKAG